MKPKNPFKLDGARPLPEKALEALNHIAQTTKRFIGILNDNEWSIA